MRRRYELDTEIWASRRTSPGDRPIIEKKMQQADAILEEIRDRIRSFGGQEEAFTDKELDMLEDIWRRITIDVQRCWMKNPPWSET
jgi:hypothetical protein